MSEREAASPPDENLRLANTPPDEDVEGHAYDAEGLEKGAAAPPDEDVEGHAWDVDNTERAASDVGDI